LKLAFERLYETITGKTSKNGEKKYATLICFKEACKKAVHNRIWYQN